MYDIKFGIYYYCSGLYLLNFFISYFCVFFVYLFAYFCVFYLFLFIICICFSGFSGFSCYLSFFLTFMCFFLSKLFNLLSIFTLSSSSFFLSSHHSFFPLVFLQEQSTSPEPLLSRTLNESINYSFITKSFHLFCSCLLKPSIVFTYFRISEWRP